MSLTIWLTAAGLIVVVAVLFAVAGREESERAAALVEAIGRRGGRKR